MELIRWSNGKGYSLLAEEEEFRLLKLNLDCYLKHIVKFNDKMEVDESILVEVKEEK